MADFFSGNGLPPAPQKKNKDRNIKGQALNWVVKNNSIIFIIILLIIAIAAMFLVTFNIGSDFVKKSLSATTILLSAVSYSLYVNGYITGDNNATQSETTITAEQRYFEEIKKIREKKVEWDINLFCQDYIQTELREYRTDLLFAGEFKPEEVEKILNGEQVDESTLTPLQLKALKACRNAKPIKLNKSMIMSPAETSRQRSPVSSANKIKSYKYRKFIFKAITVVLGASFLVAITPELITKFTVAKLIQALVQLVLLLASLFGGMRLGYSVRMRWTNRLEEITNLIGEFWGWEERRKTK